MGENPHIVFKNVQKSYDGESLVVKGLDMEIQEGEFLTMLGPSGSGKTTCLMMLAGFEAPTSGQILVRGEPVDGTPPHRRGIGMVFQNYALFPHMTVHENLAFPLQVRKTPPADIERKVDRALDMVQLAGFGGRMPGQLSGGQQQRVAVARALVFEPSLVLMDEPLGALDKNLRESMQFELKRIHGQLGVTIVYVTHDQGEALTMSDRIAVFNEGAVRQLAAPDDLYEKPENAFVARFIGENNRWQGIAKTMEDGMLRVDVSGDAEILALPVCAESGSKTTLSLRPERVFIGDAPGGRVNRAEGVIRERIYMGDHIRVSMSLPGADEFIVKIPNNATQTGLKAGDSIRVWWHPEDCRALDAED